MNERIRELIKESTTRAELPNGHYQDYFDKEKFAGLIVRKCATIADTAEPFGSSDLIKKYFGVE